MHLGGCYYVRLYFVCECLDFVASLRVSQPLKSIFSQLKVAERSWRALKVNHKPLSLPYKPEISCRVVAWMRGRGDIGKKSQTHLSGVSMLFVLRHCGFLLEFDLCLCLCLDVTDASCKLLLSGWSLGTAGRISIEAFGAGTWSGLCWLQFSRHYFIWLFFAVIDAMQTRHRGQGEGGSSAACLCSAAFCQRSNQCAMFCFFEKKKQSELNFKDLVGPCSSNLTWQLHSSKQHSPQSCPLPLEELSLSTESSEPGKYWRRSCFCEALQTRMSCFQGGNHISGPYVCVPRSSSDGKSHIEICLLLPYPQVQLKRRIFYWAEINFIKVNTASSLKCRSAHVIFLYMEGRLLKN